MNPGPNKKYKCLKTLHVKHSVGILANPKIVGKLPDGRLHKIHVNRLGGGSSGGVLLYLRNLHLINNESGEDSFELLTGPYSDMNIVLDEDISNVDFGYRTPFAVNMALFISFIYEVSDEL